MTLEQLHTEYIKIRGTTWNVENKQKLMEDFNFHSTKMEGLGLTYGDTLQFLRTGLIRPNTSKKDISDLINHKNVLEMVFDQYDTLKIDPESIKHMHKILMKDRVQWGAYDPILAGPGEFKTENNFGVRQDGFKEYLDHSKVAFATKELCKKTEAALSDPAKELDAIHDFHYQLINVIHPFTDGNGRLARLLHNLLLLKRKYPLIIIDSVQKNDYITAIIAQENNPDSKPFHTFINSILIDTMKRAIETHKARDY